MKYHKRIRGISKNSKISFSLRKKIEIRALKSRFITLNNPLPVGIDINTSYKAVIPAGIGGEDSKSSSALPPSMEATGIQNTSMCKTAQKGFHAAKKTVANIWHCHPWLMDLGIPCRDDESCKYLCTQGKGIFKGSLILSCGFVIMLLQPLAFAGDDLATLEPASSESNTPLFGDIPSVYSASKYEQKVTKAPASISIVTGDEIKKYGYRTFGQILSSLRGFYNTSDRSYGYAGARGFGLPSDYNSRLLLLIDGHRYNDSMFDAFDTSEGFPVDVDIIERVEVVRGPSSSLYGTSAVFGVINVITKRGRDQHGGNVKFSYGTNDTHKTSVSYGNRFKNGLETFVTGTWYDSQGYNSLYYPEFDQRNPGHDSRATNNGLSIGNDGERDRKLMLKAAYGDFSFQGLHLNRNKDVPTANLGAVFNNPNLNAHDQATFFELKYDHTFENQLNIQSRMSYNNYRFVGTLPLEGSTFTNLVNGDWLRFEAEASKLMWNNHHITVGGQYQDNFHQFQSFFIPNTNISLLDKNVSTYQGALFIQDDYSINDTLSLNAGVRYDYYSIFGSTINPRVGLIYNPWESTTLKLLYGTAFRAPNQSELNNTVGNVVSNPDLKPEKLNTLEFIVEHYLTRQLRAELNIFHTDIKDNITLTPIGHGISQNQNNRNVDSTGVEAQIENTWGDGFQGRLSYSWQNTTDKLTGERLTNSPEHMVKLNLIAPLWQDKVFVGFETQFMSSRKTPHRVVNGIEIPGGRVGDFVISNLTVYTQNWVKGLELSAGAYNIFDQRYFDPASPTYSQNAIQQDGIQFRIKASYDY
jgi:outer membrane receptor for ferrienterochelin and colicins